LPSGGITIVSTTEKASRVRIVFTKPSEHSKHTLSSDEENISDITGHVYIDTDMDGNTHVTLSNFDGNDNTSFKDVDVTTKVFLEQTSESDELLCRESLKRSPSVPEMSKQCKESTDKLLNLMPIDDAGPANREILTMSDSDVNDAPSSTAPSIISSVYSLGGMDKQVGLRGLLKMASSTYSLSLRSDGGIGFKLPSSQSTRMHHRNVYLLRKPGKKYVLLMSRKRPKTSINIKNTDDFSTVPISFHETKSGVTEKNSLTQEEREAMTIIRNVLNTKPF
jgi:hypothetical protein